MRSDEVIAKIDEAYEKAPEVKSRRYIGASSIGTPCDAAVSFSLRGFPEDKIEPRVQRIFRDGHRIEDTVIADLKKAGVNVMDKDPMTRRQWAYFGYGTHVKAHADGIIEFQDGVMILEIKSMNAKMFGSFVLGGVANSHPKYYDQMQTLMGLSGLRSTFFISYCKDNSEYHSEVVAFDELRWSYLKSRIETVLSGQARKIAAEPTSFSCRWCSRKGVCWEGKSVPRACETCGHARPDEGGAWWCSLKEGPATEICPEWRRYEPLPKR